MAAPIASCAVNLKLSHKHYCALLKREKRRTKRQEAARCRSTGVVQAESETEGTSDEELRRKNEEDDRLRLHEEWLRREEEAQEAFQLKQKREEEGRLRQEAAERRIREEIAKQEEREREQSEQAHREREEAVKRLLELNDKPEEESWANPEAPEDYGTERDRQHCPFFLKTGSCRFGNRCSRRHVRPTSSRVLLLRSMFSPFSLSRPDDDGSDSWLEVSEEDLNNEFLEFYHDALPEFRCIGKVCQFKVSCNYEPHLRGNVYVQFETEEECAQALFSFNGRWYAGRQLSCELCPVSRWKSAICGLFGRQRCPKGKNCNFLHVFRNPSNEFWEADHDINSVSPTSQNTASEFSDSSKGHRSLGRQRSTRDWWLRSHRQSRSREMLRNLRQSGREKLTKSRRPRGRERSPRSWRSRSRERSRSRWSRGRERSPRSRRSRSMERSPRGRRSRSGERSPRGRRSRSGERSPRGRRSRSGERSPRGRRSRSVERSPRGRRSRSGERSPRGRRPRSGERSPRGQRSRSGERSPRGRRSRSGERSPRGRRSRSGERSPQGRRSSSGESSPSGRRLRSGKPSPISLRSSHKDTTGQNWRLQSKESTAFLQLKTVNKSEDHKSMSKGNSPSSLKSDGKSTPSCEIQGSLLDQTESLLEHRMTCNYSMGQDVGKVKKRKKERKEKKEKKQKKKKKAHRDNQGEHKRKKLLCSEKLESNNKGERVVGYGEANIDEGKEESEGVKLSQVTFWDNERNGDYKQATTSSPIDTLLQEGRQDDNRNECEMVMDANQQDGHD